MYTSGYIINIFKFGFRFSFIDRKDQACRPYRFFPWIWQQNHNLRSELCQMECLSMWCCNGDVMALDYFFIHTYSGMPGIHFLEMSQYYYHWKHRSIWHIGGYVAMANKHVSVTLSVLNIVHAVWCFSQIKQLKIDYRIKIYIANRIWWL